jgi:5-methylcytosine-specific restriction endonuclease McrA
MQDFAKSFYLSKEWRAVRDNVFKRDCGLCVRCGAPGEIVHHKIHLTPHNINNPAVTLNPDNLETLCRDCHAAEHAPQPATAEGLAFDSNGDLIEVHKS